MNKFAFSFVALLAFQSCALAFAQSSKSRDPLVIEASNGNYGYIDHSGKMVIPPIFIWGDGFEDGYASVYVCGRYAWIDRSGNVVPGRPFSPEELRQKKVGSKIGFVDSAGVFRVQPTYDDVGPFHDGLAAVRRDQLWGYVDTSGREVIRPQFADAFSFVDGTANVDTDTSADVGDMLIDTAGKVLAKGYRYLEGIPSEGRIPASRGDKSGYLDRQGNVVIPFDFEFAGTFREGLAAVEKGGKYGYIDRDGGTRISFRFDEAGEFARGLAEVKVGDDSGFINKSGEFAFHLKFSNAAGFEYDGDVSRFWTDDGKFGYVNTTGKVIWGPVKETPDHAPILGWSAEGAAESCKGIPDSMKKAVAALPKDE